MLELGSGGGVFMRASYQLWPDLINMVDLVSPSPHLYSTVIAFSETVKELTGSFSQSKATLYGGHFSKTVFACFHFLKPSNPTVS